MKAYYETNKGVIRPNNEDNLIIDESPRYSLYAVADGMGGHRAGEIASALVIGVIKERFEEALAKGEFMPPRFINLSIAEANSKIWAEAKDTEEYFGMGTTITMAVIDELENTAYIGNVGDSRTYLIRDNSIKQITEDHTYVNELVREGKITIEEARKHPKKNIITRAIGSEESIVVDIFELELADKDILLLCSDGLTTHITDSNILATINEYGCECSVKRLIKLCNDNGGTDNITVIIIDNKHRGDNE